MPTMRDAAPLIDLRSDTVSVPTPEMLNAMFKADVGDDVFGEDPTVNRLEAMVAEILGHEAALFVASGTMGNLVCIRSHTEPGQEMILDANSHCYFYEHGGYAAVAGLSARFVQADGGIIRADQIPPLVRPEDVHFARSRLVVIENTHNRGGGTCYTVEGVREIADVCRLHGLRLHMDGARLWDACIATGARPADYASHCDSASVCLSKGLGCPAGSVVVGSRDFIKRAREFRKMLGGGMRQVGYLAAAGIYALEHNIERLAEDHEHARVLADGVRRCSGLRLKYDPPATNMVYFDVLPPRTVAEAARTLEAEGVRMITTGETTFRAVPHIGITRADIERVIAVLERNFG